MNKLKKLSNDLRTALQRTVRFRFHRFAYGYPRIYLFCVLAAALAGYGFLLLFPIATIVGVGELFEIIQKSQFDIATVTYALIWFAILIFCIAMSYHILTVRFELPKGVSLSSDKAPRLFAVLGDAKSSIFWPKFTSVLLSEQFELEIYKTPVNGIPVWSRNTLIIGFPLLQTLSQPYFNCILERKLLQYSKGRNVVTNWLYQLQHIWMLYPDAFSRRKLLGEQLIVWFFRVYSPFYKKFSIYMAQQEELAADSITLHHINDSDLFKSIEAQIVSEYFFQQIYLPKLNKFVRENSAAAPNIQPYTNLYRAHRKMVTPERCKNWLDMLVKKTVNTRSKIPTLSQRMHNIGHTKIRLPSLDGGSAAEYFFQSHYLAAAQVMDNIWLNKINRLLRRQYKNPTGANRRTASRTKSQLAT